MPNAHQICNIFNPVVNDLNVLIQSWLHVIMVAVTVTLEGPSPNTPGSLPSDWSKSRKLGFLLVESRPRHQQQQLEWLAANKGS